jgi:ABC-type multidrug transport system fused ATPase/permease subunit
LISLISEYLSIKKDHQSAFDRFKKQYNLIGGLRLAAIIGVLFTVYYYFHLEQEGFLYIAAFLLILFFILLKVSDRIAFKKKLSKTLVEINDAELDLQEKGVLSFEDGSEFIDPKHAYSYDLDFFGKHSLFQHLNRSATYIGKRTLADQLKNTLEKEEILQNQSAIDELKEKTAFRQRNYAYAKISDDSQNSYSDLLHWLNSSNDQVSSFQRIFSILSPVILVLLTSYYLISDNILFRSLAIMLFFINLSVLASHLKGLKQEMMSDTKMDEILKNYSLIIQAIELAEFSSEKLIRLQKQLINEHGSASKEIKQLSGIFSQLDSLNNLIGAFLMNGIALYHLHVYRSLLKWKSDHSQKVEAWLGVIGEFESLSSLATFAYNNPDFSFPSISNKDGMFFKDLGHPLLDKEACVKNTISFEKQKFIILTGSNMSGKSTFLRTLGVNMVLGSIGAPICATEASIQARKVWVSMRVSDSLEDSESYFFAEVKRLKEIMTHCEKEASFVLLDEILRGTNSDDKRSGTIEVIKKLIKKDVVGAIATHDLEVCLTTDEYPEKLVNQCFEVEIINNELYFDYTLRPGICKNKSATFLMEKMGVI